MLDTSQALCSRSKNKAFLNPGNSDQFKIAAAVRICQACPLIQECARAALAAGNLQDGTRSIADGVIVAGIVARGDQDTTDQLRAVAGLPGRPQAPRARAIQPRAYIQEGQPCRECSRPMVRWTRDKSEIPDGYSMHYAKGWCVNCRDAYKKATDRTPKRQTRERQRRPRHCVDCDAPMVPMSHELPTEDHVHHMARGRCRSCYRRSRRAVKAPLTANCL